MSKLSIRYVLTMLTLLHVELALGFNIPLPEAPTLNSREQEWVTIGRGTAESIAWHPTRNEIAVSGTTGIWLYTSEFQDIGHLDDGERQTSFIEYSPDGTKIAASSNYGQVYIWDLETEQITASFEDQTIGALARSITWSPDSRMIATTQGQDEKTVDIWEISTGNLIDSFTDVYRISAIDWSPDGEKIAVVLLGYGIQIWDTTTSTSSTISVENDLGIISITWSPSGKFLAGPAGSEIIVWEIDHYTISSRLHSASSYVRAISWNPNNGQIAAATGNGSAVREDGEIVVFDISIGQLVSTLGNFRYWATALDWSSDGVLLAGLSLDNSIKIWNTETKQLISTLDNKHTWSIDRVAWQPEGVILASLERNETDVRIRIWNTNTGELLRSLSIPPSGDTKALAWSPDGNSLLCAFTWSANENKHNIFVWNIADERDSPEFSILLEEDSIQLSWDLNGTELVILNPPLGELKMVNLATGIVSSKFSDSLYPAMAFDWSPDGEFTAIVNQENSIQILDSNTLQALLSFDIPDRYDVLPILKWGTGSDFIGFAGGNAGGSYVLVLNIHSKEFLNLSKETMNGIVNLAWNAEGNLLAGIGTFGKSLYIWDATTQQTVATFDFFLGYTTSIAWNQSQNHVAVGLADGIIQIWDADNLD
ncbi:MAG: WD40 repeat domain-containing protein [Chloroflexi bacterium]|nr:WD40 repeat domain-containing protein [Chloroflexota bacterium]